ncbi:MAG: glycosyltransferase family 4 protein [Hyphomicrobiales bacterium]|nr:glycosyltransferase family 4 protein [Hyphomicrobiales bacterium]
MVGRQIGVAWNANPVTGWGLLGFNIAVELARSGIADPLFLGGTAVQEPLVHALLKRSLDQSTQIIDARGSDTAVRDHVVLHALTTDLARTRQGRAWEGRPNIGINFLEFTGLSDKAAEQGRLYAKIFAGSRWNADLLRAKGISNVSVWEQGVDTNRFHMSPVERFFPGRFVIFSGGALTFRKGQDLVVGAFRRFHERHPDSLLLTAWRSSVRPLFAGALPRYGGVSRPPSPDEKGRPNLDAWLIGEGLPEESFVNLPVFHNQFAPDVLRQADVAVFPNRSEGGTNLVAMEAMACGLPCILSNNTGHRDLLDKSPAYALESKPFDPPPFFSRTKIRDDDDQTIETDGWGETEIDDIVETLEKVYTDREDAAAVGSGAAAAIKDWSWPKQVRRLVEAIDA